MIEVLPSYDNLENKKFSYKYSVRLPSLFNSFVKFCDNYYLDKFYCNIFDKDLMAFPDLFFIDSVGKENKENPSIIIGSDIEYSDLIIDYLLNSDIRDYSIDKCIKYLKINSKNYRWNFIECDFEVNKYSLIYKTIVSLSDKGLNDVFLEYDRGKFYRYSMYLTLDPFRFYYTAGEFNRESAWKSKNTSFNICCEILKQLDNRYERRL